jgi:protein-disulfide isomerase
VSPSGKSNRNRRPVTPAQSRAHAAREKARIARERERAAQRRRRTLLVIAAAVAVLVVAAVVAFAVNRDDGPTVPPAGTTDGGLALPRGSADAPVTVTIFEDFRCPACAALEQRLGPKIQALTDEGVLRVDYHLASFLDGNLGGNGSRRAANAAACAADEGKFPEFHDVLYANIPDEGEDLFGDRDNLLALAEEVDGLHTPAFEECVENDTHAGWVEDVQAGFDKRFDGQISTPSVLLNGEALQVPGSDEVSPALETPEAFEAAVREAAAAAGATPQPTEPATPAATPAASAPAE